MYKCAECDKLIIFSVTILLFGSNIVGFQLTLCLIVYLKTITVYTHVKKVFLNPALPYAFNSFDAPLFLHR